MVLGRRSAFIHVAKRIYVVVCMSITFNSLGTPCARLPYLISMLSDNSAVNGNVFVFPSSEHPKREVAKKVEMF